MNFEALKTLTETNNWLVIWPELCLALLALVVLALDLFIGRSRQRVVGAVASLGQLMLLVVLLVATRDGVTTDASEVLFGGMISQDSFTNVYRVFFLLSSVLTCHIASIYFRRQNLPQGEFYSVILLVTAAFMMLVQSTHFVMFFVALETVTIGFYVLVSYCRTNPFSLEAGLKYLVTGALSSSIMLFGIVLLYGVSSNPLLPLSAQDGLSYTGLRLFLEGNADNTLALVAVCMVLVGIGFKIGAFPFQIWIPDVYQGAPTPSVSALAVSSKAAGFIVLIQLLRGPFAPLTDFLMPLLQATAVVTILFGNIAAAGQHNVKRIIGMSGVSHAGYLLIGVVVMLTGEVSWAYYAILFYLFTYLLGSFAVFGVMAHVAREDDHEQELEHYERLARREPFLGAVLAIGLGSLAGIPPLVGFVGKLLLFVAAMKAEQYTLLGVAILGVIISIYYYFGWMREAFFKVFRTPSREPLGKGESRPPFPIQEHPVTGTHKLVLGTVAVFTVVLGFFQGAFGSMLM